MIKELIESGAGRKKADLVLKNASYVNVFTQEIMKGDIAITGGKIAGIGEYEGVQEIDVSNQVVLPGYIDGHMHIESSQLSPEEFASLAVPRGTTTIIADPHEITNVCGINGTDYIVKASKNVPLDVEVMLPSCVPATPFETSGAVLTGKDIKDNIGRNDIHGLAEFMNFPGIIYTDEDVIKKLEAAHSEGKVIDGHAPSVKGKELNAYLCGGVSTDHECIDIDEINEKISKGMYVHLRNGSSTRNLVPNSKAVNAKNLRRFIICTDDRHAFDLKENGHIDDALRKLVAGGMDPMWAVIIATINVAECYGLKWKGAIAPFYAADLCIVDNLKDFNAKYVIKDGKVVGQDAKPLFDTTKRYLPENVLNTVHLNEVNADDFKLKLTGEMAHVMQIIPDNVVTTKVERKIESSEDDVLIKGTDILKLAVVERHHNTGNIGKGLLEGYGFSNGCIGITIAHDSHNIILLGDDNEAMAQAANTLAKIGGGMVLIHNGEVTTVSLDIGGLMSSKNADDLIKESAAIIEKAYAAGVKQDLEAFMSLAFLSLAVIPELKVTDLGLFDVNQFKLIDINC